MEPKLRRSDFNSKPGELILEVIFNKFVTQWYVGKVVSAIQYEKARKEVELLKSVDPIDSSKQLKKGKHKSQKSGGSSRQNKLTHEDFIAILDENGNLCQENAQLRGEIAHLKSTIDDMKKRNGKKSFSQGSEDKRDHATKELEKQNSVLKKKVKALEEQNAKVSADAYLEINEKEEKIRKLGERLQKTFGEMDVLKMRLSKLAGDKLRDGNPDIADLSDPNRPTQLGTHFSEVYDNEWSDAFEALPGKDEEKVSILHGIVQTAFKFCEETFEQQTRAVKNIILAKDDDDDEEEEDDNDDKESQEPGGKNIEKTVITSSFLNDLKSIRKGLAQQTASNIAKKCAEGSAIVQLVSGFGLNKTNVNDKVKKYVSRCAELAWFMVICDPPMCLSEDKEGQIFDTNVYRPYTKSVKDLKEPVVRLHVWPALKLHITGPLVAKGVAQPGEKDCLAGEDKEEST